MYLAKVTLSCFKNLITNGRRERAHYKGGEYSRHVWLIDFYLHQNNNIWQDEKFTAMRWFWCRTVVKTEVCSRPLHWKKKCLTILRSKKNIVHQWIYWCIKAIKWAIQEDEEMCNRIKDIVTSRFLQLFSTFLESIVHRSTWGAIVAGL